MGPHHQPPAPDAYAPAGARRRAGSLIRSYDDALRFLFPRTTGGIKWGLDTTRALLAALGNPERHFASVHVGGTNGKGSTSTFLAAMLRAAGHRTGLYTSPHLVSILERFTVDGQMSSEAAFTAWVRRLEEPALELKASFFEITTAVALADFAARGVEIAVIEVGLGGRLDSTNVIDPLATGVTRIELEHTEYLGNDLVSIAREKAGIAKAGVPFLTTETHEKLVTAMAEVAEERGTKLKTVDPGLATGAELGLRGPHQIANASLAVRLAEALPAPWRPILAAIVEGLRSARLPGRFDRRGSWIFDVAHNPDGMRALTAALREANPPRPIVAVLGVLKDKDWREMREILAGAVDEIVMTTPPSAPADRRWEEGEVDFDAALASARARGKTVLVTGSFHTVGDAMARLPGYSPSV